MVLLNLSFGIVYIFASGILTGFSLKERNIYDFTMAVISFLLGIYLLISAIGSVAK